MKTPSYRPGFSSIRVLVIQPSDQLIIFVDTQSCRPINGSIDNLRNKCMHLIQMKDTLKKKFNLGTQSGQKPIWKHKRKRKKPLSSIDFGPSKQVVRNLVGSIWTKLYWRIISLNPNSLEWLEVYSEAQFKKKTLELHELWTFKTSGFKLNWKH